MFINGFVYLGSVIAKSFENIICDILLQSDITFSIRNSGGICEARLQENMKFKIRDEWATIGDEISPWHIHLNIKEVTTARFVREFNNSHNRESFSIRFLINLVIRIFVPIFQNSMTLMVILSKKRC